MRTASPPEDRTELTKLTTTQPHRLTVRCILTALLILMSAPAFAGKAEKRVQSAIDKIRDIQIDSLSDSEGRKVEQTLVKTLKVLEKHPEVARAQIREALANEVDDSFLLIELSQIYTILSPGEASLVEVAPWIERADPTAFPAGFFQVASLMGASRCQPCMRAALGILKHETLTAYIEEHALPVDLALGMLFVLGPYGEEIEGALRSKLLEGTCIEKRNAAQMIRLLIPMAFPEELATLVHGDACDEAKAEAWATIGSLGHPGIGEQVKARLSGPVAPSALEMSGMVAGLGAVYSSSVYEALDLLTAADEVEVASAATKKLDSLKDQEAETEELLKNVGSASLEAKQEMRAKLQDAVESSSFDFPGTAKELEALVDASDLALLNAARASVLRRRSDECLYEFRKLHLAAMLARQIAVNDDQR